MYRLLIENTSNGKLYDVSNIIDNIAYETNLTGSPSKLSFELIKDDTISFYEGNPVRLYYDEKPIFYGYIFSKVRNREQMIKTTCYDQTRYLKNKDSYVFINKTATQIIQAIANTFNLKTRTIADTGYVIPELIMDNKTGLDTIFTALDHTLINTGNLYVFYDNFGQLELRHVNDLRSTLVIGDESLAEDYDYKTSIDENVANKVKIIKDNKETGRREVYIVQDSTNIAKWGILQEFAKAQEGDNKAQIAERAEKILKAKNRLYRTLSLTCLGDLRVRAGTGVFINIKDLGDISYEQYFIVKSVRHKVAKGIHTMDVDVYIA